MHRNMLLWTSVNASRYLTVHVCLHLTPQAEQQKQHLSQVFELGSKLQRVTLHMLSTVPLLLIILHIK